MTGHDNPPSEWLEGLQRIGDSDVYVRLAMTGHDNPPSEWLEGVQRIGDSDVYVRLAETPADTIVWHWCPTNERWEGATIGLHTIVSREPLTITASLYRPDCCGWHGFITNGEWRPV